MLSSDAFGPKLPGSGRLERCASLFSEASQGSAANVCTKTEEPR